MYLLTTHLLRLPEQVLAVCQDKDALCHAAAISPSHTKGFPQCLHCPSGVALALRSARRCDSLEECDDGFCKDVIAITGDHMGSVGHVHILGVRTLFEETLGPCLT